MIDKIQNIINILVNDVQTLILQNIIIAAVITGIFFKISKWFESGAFRFILLIFGTVLIGELPKADNTILHNPQFYVGLGLILPHLQFLYEYIEERYYQLRYATINAYYFWLTVYYKTLRLLKGIVWLIVTIWHLGVWLFYTIHNFVRLIEYAFDILEEIVFNNSKNKPQKKRILKEYWQWYKDDWSYQSNQREYAKYEYRQWYKGTKFYYSGNKWFEADINDFNQKQQQQEQSSYNQQQDNRYDESRRQDREQEQQEQKRQEEYKKQEEAKRQQDYSKQEEQKRQEENKRREEAKRKEKEESSKQQSGSSHNQKYDRFFSGDYYTVLGVPNNASFEEVKQAWKKLVKEWHPDKNPENQKECTEIMQKINAAYEYFKKYKQ